MPVTFMEPYSDGPELRQAALDLNWTPARKGRRPVVVLAQLDYQDVSYANAMVNRTFWETVRRAGEVRAPALILSTQRAAYGRGRPFLRQLGDYLGSTSALSYRLTHVLTPDRLFLVLSQAAYGVEVPRGQQGTDGPVRWALGWVERSLFDRVGAVHGQRLDHGDFLIDMTDPWTLAGQSPPD